MFNFITTMVKSCEATFIMMDLFKEHFHGEKIKGSFKVHCHRLCVGLVLKSSDKLTAERTLPRIGKSAAQPTMLPWPSQKITRLVA